MKPRYSFTIISPNETAKKIEDWVYENWGYDYWNMNWECHDNFMINYHP